MLGSKTKRFQSVRRETISPTKIFPFSWSLLAAVVRLSIVHGRTPHPHPLPHPPPNMISGQRRQFEATFFFGSFFFYPKIFQWAVGEARCNTMLQNLQNSFAHARLGKLNTATCLCDQSSLSEKSDLCGHLSSAFLIRFWGVHPMAWMPVVLLGISKRKKGLSVTGAFPVEKICWISRSGRQSDQNQEVLCQYPL